MDVLTQTHAGVTYFIRGKHPKLLILSGTHGDEYEVTEHITQFIDTHRQELPDYLYIPEVSPSAVALKTRRNMYNHDLNREFLDIPTDPEAIANMHIMARFRFTLCLAFHEDPDRRISFYMYDNDVLTHRQLQSYRAYVQKTGASLYTGIDDPADTKLRLHVEKGYISTPVIGTKEKGFSMRWLVEHNKAERVFNPEIPGKADGELKRKLVEAVFLFSLTLV